MERNKFEQELYELGLDERFFESSSFDYDNALSKPISAMIPALMKPPELSPPQQTLYVEISLGMKTAPNKVDRKTGKPTPDAKFYKVKPMTGIFIPPAFTAQKEVEIVLYLHGHKTKYPESGASIDDYWNGGKFPFFALREMVSDSGRNIIFVAPTLGPLSQSGNLTSDKGFDRYLTKVLAALNEHFVKKNSQPEIKAVGKIILAAHSGGGSPMLRIAELKGSANASKITECWGFDSVYGDVEKRWANWAAGHPQASFYTYYNDTAGRSKTLAKIAGERNLQNVCVVGWAAKDFNEWAKSRSNLNKLKASPHFWIPVVYLKERLQNSKCRKTSGGAASREISNPFRLGKDEADFEFALEKAGLFKGKIVVAKIPADSKKREKAKKSGGAYVEVKESPSVFMPEIIRRARDKALKAGKNDVAAKLNPDDWFNNFTRDFTFLGRKLKKGQFVHIELGKLLKALETTFTTDFGISDAKKVGDILLKNSTEGISGSRLTSSTATFSMHMFGLAVDVNYLGNPFVEGSVNSKKKPPEEFGDVKAVNNVLRNAAALMNTTLVLYNQHVKDKFADRYDYVAALDATIENYFKLLDDSAALDNYLRASNSADWRDLSGKKAREKIQKNLDNLAGFLARKDYKDHFKNHAILDFDKRFVVGMEKAGLHWGGDYGDMMHFDLRKTGVGKYVDEARAEYGGKVRRQAERLFKEKKYGEHSSD